MPKSNFTLRLDDETRAWVEQEAREQQRSVANFILYVLRDYKLTHCSASNETDIR